MPGPRTQSRYLKNTSLSKKNWVAALDAPASIFAFSLSRSASKLGESGCFSGWAATETSKGAISFFYTFNKLDRVGEAAGGRVITRTRPSWRITSKRHDMSNTKLPIISKDSIHVLACRRNARQMRRWLKGSFS